MRSLTQARLWETKVAEQPTKGRDSVLRADKNLDRVADTNRAGSGDDGAERTAPPEERLPEGFAIGHAEQLADVRAGIARPAHPQRHAADAKLGVDGQIGHIGQPQGRDLLPQIARREAECIERGAIDDQNGAR